MLSKRSRPIIGKISELLISGRGSPEFATSPRSPLDFVTMQSPSGGPKKYDMGGVGLGIVAALEKSSGPKYTICSHSLCRSDPVPVAGEFGFGEELEDYTIVTCHGPGRTLTKVYYGGGVEYSTNKSDESDYPRSSFLSSCDLCGKNLDGKDIYMYRGEKAYCSTECRSTQMDHDERKEQCRSVEVARSPYTKGQIFSTGIAAI